MSDRLSLRQLDYFVVAAETGTMTAAAGRLHVSQSAVSVGIAELERQLGVQLVLRSKAKGLTLTEAGRRLLPDARALLARSDELRTSLREVGQTVTGRLVIGCFTTIGPFLLPRLLEDFQAAYPRVTLDFVEGAQDELQEHLLEGRCEVAILYDQDLLPGIEHGMLYPARPHVLLSPAHPLAGNGSVRLADLAEHDMIMLDVPPSFSYFSKVLASAGITPAIRHRTVSFEMVRSLVARGVGYSLLIQHPAVDVSYEGRQLAIRPIRDPLPAIPVVLAQPTGVQPTRRAAAFTHYCHAALAGYAEAESPARAVSR